MKRFRIIFALLLFTKFATAQIKINSLELHPSNDWLSYSFPFVYANKKIVADKINKHLQSSLLDNDSVLTDTNIVFNNVKYIRYINEDSTGQSGYTSIAYKTELNNTKILSLSFNIESMGAYPDNHRRYFNFYNKTGAILKAKDLFTSAGVSEVKKMLLRERKKRITEWIREMDSIYNNREDSTRIYEIFEECNEDAGEDDFIIRKGEVIFWKEYCFPHAARPYDTDLDVVFSYKELMRLLSDAGKKLLQ